MVASTAVSAGPCISAWLRGAGWGLVGGDILSNLSATSRAASRKGSAADCAVSESASSCFRKHSRYGKVLPEAL